MRFGNLGGFESWAAGAPEIQTLIKTEKGSEFENESEPINRNDINDVWWDSNYRIFHWNLDFYGRYYALVMLEVDRFVTSSTDYNTTITGTYKGITVTQTLSGTFDWAGEKVLLKTVIPFNDPSPEQYGDSDFDIEIICTN